MIRNIISSLFLLVVFPAKAWQQIAEKKESHDHFLNYFLYPMMGLTALSAFGGFLTPGFTLEQALKWVTINFVQYFVGFFVSAFLIDEIRQKLLEEDKNPLLSQKFAGYLLSLLMIVTIAMNILPDNFSFIRFAPLYVIYVAWEGLKYFFNVPDSKRMTFIVLVSLIILLSPIIIERIMSILMPGIRN